MKTWKRICLGAGVALVGVLCLAMTYRDTRDYLIDGFIDSVRLKLRSGSNQSSNALEIIRGSTLELAIPGSNAVAGLKRNLGIRSGQVGVIMTTSNVSFGVTYSAAPLVWVTGNIQETNDLFVTSITTTGFTINKPLATSNLVSWLAIGAP